MGNKLILNKELFKEIFRYILVGGLATIVDWTIYFIFQNYVFIGNVYSYYYSAFLGFMAGLIINYILSISFVFKNVENKEETKTFKSFMIFLIIGVIGLLLTEAGLFLGSVIFKENFQIKIVNMMVRCFMTCVVLVWNYLARKILIFK